MSSRCKRTSKNVAWPVSFILWPLLTALLAQVSPEVEYIEFEVIVQIDALDYADFHDSTIEYKISLDQQTKIGRGMLGTFTGSSAFNIFKFFTDYTRVRVGESIFVKSKLTLAKKLIPKLELRPMVLEADFSIIVPGPCCLVMNENDRIAVERFELQEGEAIVTPLMTLLVSSSPLYKLVRALLSLISLKEITRMQMLPGSFFNEEEANIVRLLRLMDEQ